MTMDAVPITLAGPWNVLLSHMALIGAASIVDEALGPGSARIRWTDEVDPLPQLRADGLTSDALGEIVHDHAVRHVEDESGWLHVTDAVSGSLFAARTKMPATDAAWGELLAARAAAARELRGLDSALTVGIGERAWWHRDHKRLRPDHGASAWEMRTRNKGMEFIAHALLPAGRAVAAREADEVMSGLSGATLRDEPGKGKPDSRTATGLAPLGPADAARVWAGLWALASLPVWASAHGRSVSSASLPPRTGQVGHLRVPMPTSWVVLGRMEAALRSRHLTAAAGLADQAPARGLRVRAGSLEGPPALEDWGFSQVVDFRVQVSGSTSAPERRSMAGEVTR